MVSSTALASGDDKLRPALNSLQPGDSSKVVEGINDITRCFVALGIDPAPGPALAPTLDDLRARFRELAVPPPQNLHLTLAFLGELDEAGVARAREGTAAAALALAEGWALSWGTAGAFPSLARARVLWLGLEDPVPTARARAVLAEHLVAAGLPVADRAFRPHLTLARLRGGVSRERADQLKEALAGVPRPPGARTESLVLFSSHLGRGRPSQYEELLVARLR